MTPLNIHRMDGDTLSVFARPVEEPLAAEGLLYEILGDDGELEPQVFDHDGPRKPTLAFYDCVEVVQTTAYAYDRMSQKRVGELGALV